MAKWQIALFCCFVSLTGCVGPAAKEKNSMLWYGKLPLSQQAATVVYEV